MEAFGFDRLPVDFDSFWNPDASKTGPRVFDNLQADVEGFLDPGLKFASIARVCPDQLEARQLPRQRCQEHLAAITIGDVSRQHFRLDDQSLAVHQQVPFSAPDFFFLRRSPLDRHEPNWF